MAKATQRFVEKEVVTKVKQADGITLELTNGEARLVAFLLYGVGGQPEKTARGTAEQIKRAMRDAGVDMSDFYDLYYSAISNSTGVYLNEKSKEAFK